MGRSFASRVSHPTLKWVVLLLWLVLAAAATPLAAGLTDQQDNEISSWLPGDAESTLALEQQIALGPVGPGVGVCGCHGGGVHGAMRSWESVRRCRPG